MRTSTLFVMACCSILIVTWSLLQNPQQHPRRSRKEMVILYPITTTPSPTSTQQDLGLDSEILRQFLKKYGARPRFSTHASLNPNDKHLMNFDRVTQAQTVLQLSVTTKFSLRPFTQPSAHKLSHPTTTKLPVRTKHKTTLAPSELQKHPKNTNTVKVPEGPCPTGPIVTVQNGGRLGNKVWEYAAAWSLGRILKRPAYIPTSIHQYLAYVFANLSLPRLESISHCNLDLGAPQKRLSLTPLARVASRFKNKHILLHKWIILPEPILKLRNHLKEEFRFLPWIQNRVRETFKKFQRSGATYVGVHIRRTDFATYLPKEFNASLVTANYFQKAMNWFRKKLDKNLIFVIVSDDPEWCKEELVKHSDDVVLAAKSGTASAGHDLAVLASCNHTIIDYGTYGLWGALMAGGYTISIALDTKVDEVLVTDPNWQLLTA